MFGRKSSRSKTQPTDPPSRLSSDDSSDHAADHAADDAAEEASQRVQADLAITFLMGNRKIAVKVRNSKNEEGIASLLEMATDRKFTENERLACQTTLNHQTRANSLRVRIPEPDAD